jgi:hypothetical protein
LQGGRRKLAAFLLSSATRSTSQMTAPWQPEDQGARPFASESWVLNHRRRPINISAFRHQRHGEGLTMPARIVVVLNNPKLADAAVSALMANGYDALAIHDSMAALTLLEHAQDIELLVTSTYFQEGKPTGAALALMTKTKRPQLRVVFVGDPHLAALLDDIGQMIAEPISPLRVVDIVRIALPA